MSSSEHHFGTPVDDELRPAGNSNQIPVQASLTHEEEELLESSVAKAAGSWLVQTLLRELIQHSAFEAKLTAFDGRKLANWKSLPSELDDVIRRGFLHKDDQKWERDVVVELLKQLETKLRERIIGQDELVRAILISLVLNEHALLEGLPGVGKTEIVKWVAEVCGIPFSRVQFIPDMLPSDLIGKDHIDIAKLNRHDPSAVRWVNGPIFGSIVLADEINRAPSKVQAALLEAMAERQVTPFGKPSIPVLSPLHEAAFRVWAERHTFGLLGFAKPVPGTRRGLQHLGQFTVLATMNPIEQEGTYPLSEAQTDRFSFKVIVPYPSRETYEDIAHVNYAAEPLNAIEANPSVEACKSYFRCHPTLMLPILLPAYFFLLCRAHVLPLKIHGRADADTGGHTLPDDWESQHLLRPSTCSMDVGGHTLPDDWESQRTSLYEQLSSQMGQRRDGRMLQLIHDIVWMTTARTFPADEGGQNAGQYDVVQLRLRDYINRIPVEDGRRRQRLLRILEQPHCQYVMAGASPRGFLKLIPAVLCHSMIRGRVEICREDILAAAASVLRHRIHMDVHARLAGVSSEDVIHSVCQILLEP